MPVTALRVFGLRVYTTHHACISAAGFLVERGVNLRTPVEAAKFSFSRSDICMRPLGIKLGPGLAVSDGLAKVITLLKTCLVSLNSHKML